MYERFHAADTYARSNVMTAGKLKSYQLLIERALILIHKQIENGFDERIRNRVQDIIAQIQAGLKLGSAESQDMFRALGIVWDAMESPDPEVMKAAIKPLKVLKHTIDMIQHRLENPRAMGTFRAREEFLHSFENANSEFADSGSADSESAEKAPEDTP